MPASIYRRKFNAQLVSLFVGSTFAGDMFAKTHAKATDDVLLAKNAPKGIDPTGYLISEKLDGVRALWDGKQLRFRSGKAIAAPQWFTDKLPKTALDGELWLARGAFDKLSGIVRKAQPIDSEWQQVNYMVFELPASHAFTGKSFEQRYVHLRTIVQAADFAQLQTVLQFTASNQATLQAKLQEVVQAGGEGLVLHLAQAPYTTGRSDVLLKLKPQQDAEATVVAHITGKGKYAGMTGALAVKTPEGIRFKLGTGLSDHERQHPPAIGSTVTYTYTDLTPAGKPRFARFLRVYQAD
ncbi:MAG TPA: DNA ligase [Burkholderiaceae bacterium]|nr:DNA ligase [Burkholderiaceae bacterium]